MYPPVVSLVSRRLDVDSSSTARSSLVSIDATDRMDEK